VPLRTVDVERLPSFFYSAGYEPGSRISPELLGRDLSHWNSASAFTAAGASALADERRQAVLAQVASELECWDGAVNDVVLHRRSAVVEILLDPRPRRPMLYHLPHRPAGFPERFDDGAHVFVSSDQGWYEPVPVKREEGDLLASGFEWETSTNGTRTILRRGPKTAVALTPSDSYAGFLSNRSLMAGVACAVLCRDEKVSAAAAYLSEISEMEVRSMTHPNLPDGWQLFTNILPRRFRDAPNGLDSLLVDSAVTIVPVGGLRVGRRWQWLRGAPPRLVVSGLLGDERVEIDGVAAVTHDGQVEPSDSFNEPGLHLVRAGRTERTIEIVDPTVGNVADDGQSGTQCSYGVGLPPGSWLLLGTNPGEVFAAGARRLNGVFAAPPFEPIWAVEAGHGPGARAYCLSPGGSGPQRRRVSFSGLQRGALEKWATTIYSAHIRRPVISSCLPAAADELDRLWTLYFNCARELKRDLRRRSK